MAYGAVPVDALGDGNGERPSHCGGQLTVAAPTEGVGTPIEVGFGGAVRKPVPGGRCRFTHIDAPGVDGQPEDNGPCRKAVSVRTR